MKGVFLYYIITSANICISFDYTIKPFAISTARFHKKKIVTMEGIYFDETQQKKNGYKNINKKIWCTRNMSPITLIKMVNSFHEMYEFCCVPFISNSILFFLCHIYFSHLFCVCFHFFLFCYLQNMHNILFIRFPYSPSLHNTYFSYLQK